METEETRVKEKGRDITETDRKRQHLVYWIYGLIGITVIGIFIGLEAMIGNGFEWTRVITTIAVTISLVYVGMHLRLLVNY